MSKKSEADDLMEGLDSSTETKKTVPVKTTGKVKIDVFLGETPQDKYTESLLQHFYKTERHTMSEWADVLAKMMSRSLTSD